MGITVAVRVEHLELPKILVSTPSEQSGIVLVPNVAHYGTIKATVKEFVRRNLFIPEELQVLQAPLFRKVDEKENVEDIYKRYACQAEVDNPDLHFDEDNLLFFAREGCRSVDLEDDKRLEEYHIVEKSVLHLRRLPRSLSLDGGRIFVETKDGILPLLDVKYSTPVLEVKRSLEKMTGIAINQQILSSVGRSMHDGLCMKDFDGAHRVCEDSILDLCKSGDSNAEQAHLRMVIYVNVMGEQGFTMVVQGRDLVQSVQQIVELRTGVAPWQQRITYSGKVLHERKTLSEYFIRPDCTLQVTIFRSPCKPPPKMVNVHPHSRENSESENQKPAARKIKMLRTSKGRIMGAITIPVLTTDTVSDLKRKVKRTLQPLTERNFVVLRSPVSSGNNNVNNTTPNKIGPSPSQGDPLSTSSRRLSRVLSFTGKTFSGPLSNNGTPKSKTPTPTAATTAVNGDASTPSVTGLTADAPGGTPGSGKKVARVLSFDRFTGPLVSPSKHAMIPPTMPPTVPPTIPPTIPATAQPTSTQLFPPPLSTPNGSPTGKSKRFSDVPTVPETEVATERELLNGANVEEAGRGPAPGSAPAAAPAAGAPPAGPPLKFVPMRPSPVSATPNPSTVPISPKISGRRTNYTRAASMGHIPYTPAQLHSLPVAVLPRDCLLPHTAPIADSTNENISPKSNGRERESTPVTAERRGLGAWLTGSMQVLRDHIKSPFVER